MYYHYTRTWPVAVQVCRGLAMHVLKHFAGELYILAHIPQKNHCPVRAHVVATRVFRGHKTTFGGIYAAFLILDELNVFFYKIGFCEVLTPIRLKKNSHPLFIRTVLVSHRDVQKS